MRRSVKNRNIVRPDYKYGSYTVSKFINYIMEAGKKSTAEKVVFSALDEIAKVTKKDPLQVFEEAIKNATPLLEVRSRRVGGANYQVPREVAPNRGLSLAMRWIIAATRAKKGAPMHKKLADELIAAAKNDGAAIKKRQDTHKMAEANKAFAHFAW